MYIYIYVFYTYMYIYIPILSWTEDDQGILGELSKILYETSFHFKNFWQGSLLHIIILISNIKVFL